MVRRDLLEAIIFGWNFVGLGLFFVWSGYQLLLNTNLSMTDHQQFNLSSVPEALTNPQLQGIENSPNVWKTAKQILSNDKITGKYFSGNFLVRGVNTTGYSTVTVFDVDQPGFHQIRTFLDVGNATITTTYPGQKGQELYMKIDNDTDANRTITFGSNFKVTGTLAGSTAASAIFYFISDGSFFLGGLPTTRPN